MSYRRNLNLNESGQLLRPDPHIMTIHSLSQLCSKVQLEQLFKNREEYTIRKNKHIYHSSKVVKGIYCLLSGYAKISVITDHQKEQIIRIAKPGDILGYRPIYGNQKHSNSAVALEHCSIRLIPKDDFLQLLKENEDLNMEVINLLCNEINYLELKMAHIAYRPVKARIADAILGLQDVYDESNDFKIHFTKANLAALTGSTRETVTRIIQEMEKDKVLLNHGRDIEIKDEEGLRHISQNHTY